MTQVPYDPDLWLESLTRALGSFCGVSLGDPDVQVEMSFPDTSQWTKEMPLTKAIVHFEQDDIQSPILGFGNPGVDTVNDVNGTVVHQEAVQHLVNFDVGIWVSAENGGVTKRMELTRKLKDMFTSVGGKEAFNEATGGLWPVSFEGGLNQLDRINDLPLWRTMGMTLIVRCFSRITPPGPFVVVGDFTQDPHLVIDDNGTDKPVVTP
jgi:hypothetical protein